MTLPETLTRIEMADLLGITPQRVGQLSTVLSRRPDGMYPLAGAVDAYADFVVASKTRRRTNPSLTRLQERQAEQLEHRLAREEAQLITMAETAETFGAVVSAMAGALRDLPSRLGDAVPADRAKSICDDAASEFEAKAGDIFAALQGGRGPNQPKAQYLTE